MSKADFDSLPRFESASKTLKYMLDYGVVPIVNENDTVASEENKFGDNDTISSMISILCSAKWCFLLTDVDFLYDKNPKDHEDAKPLYEVFDVNSELQNVNYKTLGSQWGSGGMETKIKAAKIASSAGVNLVIMNASKPENMKKILDGEKLGTVFYGKKVDSSITSNRK